MTDQSFKKRFSHLEIRCLIMATALSAAFLFACADNVSVKKVQAEDVEQVTGERIVLQADANVRTMEEWYNLGVSSAKDGNFKEAKKAFKEAIKLNPDYAEAHHRLGLAYKALGDKRYSLRAFREAIRINPDLAEAYYSLGTAYRELGDEQGAVQAFQDVIRITPSNAHAHYHLGEIYLDMRLKREAKAAFINAIDIKPDFAEAHYGLGSIYVMFNDIGSAFAQFKILIELDRPLAYKLFKQIYK